MTKKEELDREGVSIRSEVVQEIMGKVPNILIRWGNTLILIFALGILLISYFIRYPNILKTKIELTSTNPSSWIHAPINGRLTRLEIKNGSLVEKNTLLARIMSNDGAIHDLRSQIKGKVYIIAFVNEENMVEEGESLFKIVSLESDTYQGIIRLTIQNLNKIRAGQKVRIRLSNTVTDQKVISGSVARVSQVANEQGLVAVQILLDNGLITTSGQKLRYISGMQGTAELVMENPRLIEHFLYQLKNIFK